MNELIDTSFRFLEVYPEVSAILVALAGLLIARVLASLATAGLAGLELLMKRMAPNWLGQGSLTRFRPLVWGLTFYPALFFFLLLALGTLNIDIVEEWLDEALSYVADIFLAIVILVVGYLLALLAQATVSSLLPRGSAQLLPRLAFLLVISVALLTALAQMDIDTSLVTWTIVLLIGTFMGGLALAFALGSGQLVANILAKREAGRYKIGNRVRIGELEGVIVDVLDTAVLVENQEGTTAIPTARFAAEPVTLVSPEPAKGKNHDD